MNKGYLYVIATAVISGFSIWLNQFAVKGINPILFTTLKNTLVAITFLFIVKKASLNLNFKKAIKLSFVGVFGGALAFILFFTGLASGNAAMASLIHKTMFLYIAVLSVIFLKEKLSKLQFFGLACILFGLLILSGFQLTYFNGLEFIFVATLIWAIENVVSKNLIDDNTSASIVALARMGIGSLVLWSLVFAQSIPISLSIEQIIWVLITSILLFGYVFTWYHSLEYISVSEAAAILSLGSVITISLSYFMGVEILIFEIIGMVLITLGCISVSKSTVNNLF